MSNHPPTAEQQEIIGAFATGQDLIVEAGAGTGKTSTLVLLGKSTDRKGLYVAFTKNTQKDAEPRFAGTNVECRTAHSLAFGAIIFRQGYKDRFERSQKRSNRDVQKFLHLQAISLDEEHAIGPKALASAIRQTVTNYTKSASENITKWHVDMPILPPGTEHKADDLRSYILAKANKYWLDTINKAGYLPFGHDHYLKLYQLSKPILRKDFILYDEAQDANPVIADIVQRQTCQKVMVGDRNQQIFAWNGAVDAMEKFEADKRLALQQSFRFGPAIAETANKWLGAIGSEVNGEAFRIKGFDQIDSKVEPITDTPNAILCRTNATCIAEALSYQEQGKKVAIAGGAQQIMYFAEAANDLMQGIPTDHPELCAFKDWTEVQAYAADEGTEIRTLVRLIDTHGTFAILEIGRKCVDESDADIVISTAHKAKGREWDRVRIANDFKPPEEGQQLSRADMMLAYVAVTRAKRILDDAGLSWIDAYLLDMSGDEGEQ